MKQFDAITESLRKQRKNVDDELESTSHRSAETASIIAKIEELRARAEVTNRGSRQAPPSARNRDGDSGSSDSTT